MKSNGAVKGNRHLQSLPKDEMGKFIQPHRSNNSKYQGKPGSNNSSKRRSISGNGPLRQPFAMKNHQVALGQGENVLW
jgi:hypothetical protein